MERRDVALAIAIGLLLGGVALVINDAGPISWAVGLAYRFWYVGVAAVVVAVVLASRGLSQTAARFIGFAGMVWVAFLLGGQLLILVGNAIASPQGA